MNNSEIEFNRLVKEAKNNPAILGLILGGSRGKGFENKYSDYDLIIITKNECAKEIQKQYNNKKLVDIDIAVMSLIEFKKYASLDTSEAWDRYNYAHVKILFDRTKTLGKIITDKGCIPKNKLNKFIDYWIDGYVNGVFRSVKCLRNKNKFGAHLEAVNSMLDLLTLVFALNGRHRPFLGYTEKELLMFPLRELPWSNKDFVKMISKVLKNGDLKTQQKLLRGMEIWCRKVGHGHMFDGWKGKDQWTMNYAK